MICRKNKIKKIKVAVSGYFNPLHVGHLEMIEKSKKLGDYLIVIVNSDYQVKLKGSFPFMNEKDRIKIIASLRDVDEVFLSIDKDKTVCKSLAKIKPDIFANGGDRKSLNDVPEFNICQKLNIKMLDGMGKKIRSSSILIANATKKRKKQNNKILSIKYIFLLFLVFIVILFFYYLNILNSPAGIEQERVFIVERGQSVSEISANLHKEGLIKSDFIFKFYIKRSSKNYIFREGSYNLNYKMNMKEILTELTKSISLKPEKKITFIEGWNLRDYAKILEEKEFFNKEDFFDLVGEPMLNYKLLSSNKELKDYSERFDFLKDKPKEYGLEGYLFPDTYNFFIDATADDIIIKMLQNFDKKLTQEMRNEIKKQEKTIYEIITMASIVEKEVQSEKDMKMVSGIFWNRIKSRQALESCATLAYILGVNKAIYSFEDTRIPSSYNTYINRGLPSGPISNPGLKAIEAAIYPEPNNYNYFLTNPETKETMFSRTYNEHLLNKNKYLK